jgi:hypothetical protein
LPRSSKVGARFPLFSEHIDVIAQSDWKDYPGVSMRPFVKEILDQGQVGSCATEGTAQSLMIARAFAGLEHVSLNPWFIYHHTNGGRDAGSSIDDNLAFAMEHGIAPASVWPRSKGWQTKPSEEAYAEALKYRVTEVYDVTSVVEMVSALLKGFAVVYGANGHCVVKVEHQTEQKGLDVNSWGTSWGDHGFGVWATYRQVNLAYGAFAVRTTTETTK